MMRINLSVLLTILVLSTAASMTARAGDHSFSCVTNDKPFGQKYDLFEGGDLQAVDEINKNGEPQVLSKVVKYNTLHKITIHQEEFTCVTKDGRSHFYRRNHAYVIALKTEESDREATLLFLCSEGAGASFDPCTKMDRFNRKVKVLHPMYRYQVKDAKE